MYETVRQHSERTDREFKLDVELQQNVAYVPIGEKQ
jgi:hypothetical protein